MVKTKTLPYMAAYGNITKCLDGIIRAKVPEQFTRDFLDTMLKVTGGGARPIPKYLKDIGFLNESSVPTQAYKDFRDSGKRGHVAAEALRTGYASLFEYNEYVHEATEKKLKEAISSVLGYSKDDKRIPSIVRSFQNLKEYADFESTPFEDVIDESSEKQTEDSAVQRIIDNHGHSREPQKVRLNLGYTINLNLPESTDPNVYASIFKALKEELLSNE